MKNAFFATALLAACTTACALSDAPDPGAQPVLATADSAALGWVQAKTFSEFCKAPVDGLDEVMGQSLDAQGKALVLDAAVFNAGLLARDEFALQNCPERLQWARGFVQAQRTRLRPF